MDPNNPLVFTHRSLTRFLGRLQYKYRLVDKFKVRGTVEPKPPRIYQLVNRSPFTYSSKRRAHFSRSRKINWRSQAQEPFFKMYAMMKNL